MDGDGDDDLDGFLLGGDDRSSLHLHGDPSWRLLRSQSSNAGDFAICGSLFLCRPYAEHPYLQRPLSSPPLLQTWHVIPPVLHPSKRVLHRQEVHSIFA